MFEWNLIGAINLLIIISAIALLSTDGAIRKYIILCVLFSASMYFRSGIWALFLPIFLISFVYKKDRWCAIAMLVPLLIYGASFVFDYFYWDIYNLSVYLMLLGVAGVMAYHEEIIMAIFIGALGILWFFYYIPECVLILSGYLIYMSVKNFKGSVLYNIFLRMTIMINQTVVFMSVYLGSVDMRHFGRKRSKAV